MRRAEAEKKKRFSTGRSRLLVLVSIFGVLGIVALLVAISDTGTPSQAGAAKMNDPAVLNPSAVSVLPNSWAIAKGPFNSTKASSKARAVEPSSTITAGDSKAHCITLSFTYGQLNQSEISAVTDLTGVTYNCVELFANPIPTWAEWETPWMFSDISDGWDAWLDTNPAHQVVMGMDLIPQSVSNNDDPLSWEESCAAGSYNQYATTLAKNLVSWGAGSIVIRLGPEANGAWEADYVGSTTTEMNDWAKCYDNEVTAMRSVSGTHFLFIWNPNACTTDLPLDEWYPGNSYVDIIGIDAYDNDCSSQMTVSQEGWTAFLNNSAGNTPNDPNFPSIANMEAFAVANGKPLSFPEWGISGTDDAAYVTDMAQIFKQDDFSFESYFDDSDDGITPLGPEIPDSTAAYSQAFK